MTAGIPSRGIAKVVPAAPGTPRCVSPTAGPCGAGGCCAGGWPGMRMPVPVTSAAFSSFVIAAITSLSGLLPSWGSAA